MTVQRFNPENDFAPMPFDERICLKALEMKKNHLVWRPHVGCFVWDPEEIIKPASPFPGRIYFILSLARFIEIFDTMDQIAAKLVWLPTWHQARLLCSQLGVPESAVSNLWQGDDTLATGEELHGLYHLMWDALIEENFSAFIGQKSEQLDKIAIGALTQRMGNISALPEELTDKIVCAYHQFVDAYLNVLRQKENKPLDWFPRTLSIDPELADGMRHFYSDYQHITRKFFKLNQKLDRLRAIDKNSQFTLFQDRIDKILELCAV